MARNPLRAPSGLCVGLGPGAQRASDEGQARHPGGDSEGALHFVVVPKSERAFRASGVNGAPTPVPLGESTGSSPPAPGISLGFLRAQWEKHLSFFLSSSRPELRGPVGTQGPACCQTPKSCTPPEGLERQRHPQGLEKCFLATHGGCSLEADVGRVNLTG